MCSLLNNSDKKKYSAHRLYRSKSQQGTARAKTTDFRTNILGGKALALPLPQRKMTLLYNLCQLSNFQGRSSVEDRESEYSFQTMDSRTRAGMTSTGPGRSTARTILGDKASRQTSSGDRNFQWCMWSA